MDHTITHESRKRLGLPLVELLAAAMLHLSFTATSVTALLVYQSLAGFFLFSFFSTFWALPMNSVPKELMGITSGTINMAGQLAAFLAPILMGLLTQVGGGDFRFTSLLLIGALVVSAMIVLTIPARATQSRSLAAAD